MRPEMLPEMNRSPLRHPYAGLVEVELANGWRVRCPSDGLAEAASVQIGVRPEKLRLERTADDDSLSGSATNGSNQLLGRVNDASYVGVSTQYVVNLDDGKQVVVYAQNLEVAGVAEQHPVGQRVRLSWLPKHTFVINAPAAADRRDPADA